MPDPTAAPATDAAGTAGRPRPDPEDEPPPRHRPAAGRDPVAGRPAPLAPGRPPRAAALPRHRRLRDDAPADRGAHRATSPRASRTSRPSSGTSAPPPTTSRRSPTRWPATCRTTRPASTSWPTRPSSASAIPLTPLTLLAGPQVTFVVVELLGLTLTASAWYWLVRRRLAVHPRRGLPRRGARGLRTGDGQPRERPPELRRPGPRARSSSTGCCASPRAAARCATAWCSGCWWPGRCSSARRSCCSPRSACVVGARPRWRTAGCRCASAAAPASASGAARPGRRRAAAVVAVLRPAELRLDLAPAGRQRPRPAVGPRDPHRRRRPVGVGRPVDEPHRGELVLRGRRCGSRPPPPSCLLWRSVVVRALAAVVLVTCWLSLGEEVTLHGDAARHPGPVGAARARAGRRERPARPGSRSSPCPPSGCCSPSASRRCAARRRPVRRLVRGPGLALAGTSVGVLALLPVVPDPARRRPAHRPCRPSSPTGRGVTTSTTAGRCSPRRRRTSPTPAPWSGRQRPRWGFPVVAGYFVGPERHRPSGSGSTARPRPA